MFTDMYKTIVVYQQVYILVLYGPSYSSEILKMLRVPGDMAKVFFYH